MVLVPTRRVAVVAQAVGFALLLGVVFVASALQPYQTTPDTTEYLAKDLKRTPVYPLFLEFASLVGGRFQLKVAQLLQVALGCAAAVWLAHSLAARAGLTAGCRGLLFLLLVFPQLRKSVGPSITTESLSYAFFLVFLAMLLRGVERPSLGAIGMLCTAGAALVLTRPQFLFVVPVAVAYVLWALAMLDSLPRRLAAIALFVSIACVVPLAQSGYNLAFNGAFMRIPFTGYQLLATASYVADPEDVLAVSDHQQRAFLQNVAIRAEALGLTERHRIPEESTFRHFNRVYNDLLRLIVDTHERQSGKPLASPASWLEFDRFTLQTSLRLIRKQPHRLVRHIAKQLQETAGYLPVLMALMVGVGLGTYLRTHWPLALVVAAVSALGLSNYILIGLVEPIATRYAFYTEAVQLPFLLALLGTLIREACPEEVRLAMKSEDSNCHDPGTRPNSALIAPSRRGGGPSA